MNKLTMVLLTFVALLFASIKSENCIAPYNTWGPLCYADNLYQGQKGFFINYHIGVKAIGAQVYCKGLGITQFIPSPTCSWQLWDLGLISQKYVSLVWDNAYAKPIIQCFSMNYQSEIEWTYTTGSSQTTCLRGTEI